MPAGSVAYATTPPRMSPVERVTVSLPPDLRRAAPRVADDAGMSFSSIVTEALVSWRRARLVDVWARRAPGADAPTRPSAVGDPIDRNAPGAICAGPHPRAGAYQVSMQGRFLCARGSGAGTDRRAPITPRRESTGSITSSISK